MTWIRTVPLSEGDDALPGLDVEAIEKGGEELWLQGADRHVATVGRCVGRVEGSSTVEQIGGQPTHGGKSNGQLRESAEGDDLSAQP